MIPQKSPVRTKNKFSTVAGNKINTPKSVACLQTNNEPSENDIEKIIQLTVDANRI